MPNNEQTKATHYIHRTSYGFQEQLVGAFILVTVGLLLAMLFAQIKSQNIFEEYFVIYGKLSSAEGLSKETIVQISGFEVGHVSAIDITDKNDILLTMNIVKRYHKLLRTDSRIKVSSLNATIIGKSIISITAGSPDLAMIDEGVTLAVQESRSVEDVIAEATETIQTVNSVIEDISNVVAAVEPKKIADTISAFQQLATNIKDMSEHIKTGAGPVGTLIYDDKSSQDFKQGIENLHATTVQINQMVESLNTDVQKIPLMLESINAVIDDTDETIKATQRVWPISSAMSGSDNKQLITDPMPAND
ncbi:MAG: MlaD family protein [Gammaproteobacteria bacterium]|nr:MlaD family protein [Gammaproteobacteria bacterium]